MLPITCKNILLDIVIGLALHLPTVRPEPTHQLGYLRTGANGVIFIYRPVIEPGAIRTVFPNHWSGNQTRTNVSTQAHLPNKPVTQARSKSYGRAHVKYAPATCDYQSNTRFYTSQIE
jgi:hypothetical protein